MRTAVVGVSALEDRGATAASARAVAELTHADPLAGDSCVLWCEAIRVAVTEGRLDVTGGLDLLHSDRRDQWVTWLDEADSRPPESFSPNGFTVTALQAAWAAIRRTVVEHDDPANGHFAASHFEHSLQAAIRIGDDTDTVAAIAGGLLGAYWGVSAIPARWRSVVHGWPGWRARDLVAAASLTARHGRPGPYGWPAIPHIDYAGASTPLAPVSHPYDKGVTLGTVWPTEHQTDVVVTLCLLGTERRNLPAVPDADQLEVWLIDDDDPSSNPHLDFVLADTASFVASQRDAGKAVFVHCVAAHQRTPSVALAYAVARGHDAQEAAERIKAVLPSTRGRGALWAAAADVRAIAG